MSAASNENQSYNDSNDNANKIIFTVKDTKLYVPVVTLSWKDNHKLLTLLSKGFERSVLLDKTKSENKNMANEFRYFLKSNIDGVNRLFVLVDQNGGNEEKWFNTRKCYLPKGITKNITLSSIGKTVMIKQSIVIYNDTNKLEN